MNKWELKNMLEELRTDNTRHTETINKQITHIQALWEEIEQKQYKITRLEDEKTELKTHYRDCMLREKKAVADAAQDEKFCTEHILNKSTNN
tara:strand:+ start:905 stop:1180 length:276 start_codon:yes stop_codon:yes gene_type:complete